MKTTKLSQNGLTIIELVIVLVIIAVLSAVGFTSYLAAKNRELKNNAQSTLSQVQVKLSSYYNEKEAYPATKDDLATYLKAQSAPDLAAALLASDSVYSYIGRADEPCTTADNTCSTYTLSASKSYWNGDGSQSDITVTP